MLDHFQQHPDGEDCLTQEEAGRARWQHEHMMREDYEGLFYRKLNLIIMLEECEQAYQEREILMISHRDHPDTRRQGYAHRQPAMDVHPVTFLSKQMAKHNQRLKAEMALRKKEAEAQVQIGNLEIDRKCLLEEIVVFTSTINDIAYQKFEENQCKTAETILIEQGKKYNLSTTIIGFIKQAKEIAVSNIIAQCLKTSLKRLNFNSTKPLLKLQQLRGIYRPGKSKRELLEHITLYLKQFRSNNIFKQLTESLNALLAAYDSIGLHSHYLFNKITEEIFSNLHRLATVNRELDAHISQVKDCRIDIQILVEEMKLSEKEVKELEQRSAQCIDQEAAFLSRQYSQTKNIRQLNESFGQDPSLSEREYLQPESDYFSYFHQKLKQKYQQFVKNQLQDAQHIRIIKENIEAQTSNLQNLKRFYNAMVTPPRSQLNTHRTIEESIFSEFNYPLKEANVNSSTKPSQQRSSEQCLNHSLKRTSLPGQKDKLLVKKIFKISSNSKPIGSTNQRDKIYELKLTKKHIVLQQQTNNTLQLSEKVQIQRIKGHKLQEDEQIISFDCGSNSLKLQFISGNIASFLSKLDRLNRMAKDNCMPSRR